jgi:hypothetical protein
MLFDFPLVFGLDLAGLGSESAADFLSPDVAITGFIFLPGSSSFWTPFSINPLSV